MKKIFTVVGFCLMVSAIMAQGNALQFNQALILNNGTTYTVPAAKVWKVESAVYTGFNIGYTYTATVVIDGTSVDMMPFSFYDGNAYARAPISTAFPMWLPAATTVQPTGKTAKMFVIEFNLVTL